MTKGLLLVVLALLFVACSEPVTSPSDKVDEETPQDTSGFTITRLYLDSMYWGEQTSIQVNESGDDISKLALFIHTVPVISDSLVGGRLYFTIPEGASTGKIRLYKNDTLAAGGSFTLTILPAFSSILNPTVATVSPTTVAVGDLIYIGGFDFPLRQRDVIVKIANVQQTIEFLDHATILIRVAPGTTTGLLSVRLFDLVHVGSVVTVYQPSDTLLRGDALSEITIQATGLNGTATILRGGISQNILGFDIYSQADLLPKSGDLQRVGDSIFFVQRQSSVQDTTYVELRLRHVPGAHKVSGIVRMLRITGRTTSNEVLKEVSFTLNGMAFYSVGNTATIYSTATDITHQLQDLRYRDDYVGMEISQQVLEYLGGVGSSTFNIVLRY